MKYGIELEFFVTNKVGNVIPAYKATSHLDGNPIIGELRTGVHDNIVDCVFELKKLIHLERQALKLKECQLAFHPEIKLLDEVIKEMRGDQQYTDAKELRVLKELSIYGKGTGKVLPKGVYKASLQLNISENHLFAYDKYERITIGEAYRYESKTAFEKYSGVFDYVSIIRKLDEMFSMEITDTKRVKGVYAIKDGIYGKRVEYRSLPNNINIDTLLTI